MEHEVLRDRDLARVGGPARAASQPLPFHDERGIPKTPRAQWLYSLFAAGALVRECDHLLKPTVDPTTKKVLAATVPYSVCAVCGASFQAFGRAKCAVLCVACRGGYRRMG